MFVNNWSKNYDLHELRVILFRIILKAQMTNAEVFLRHRTHQWARLVPVHTAGLRTWVSVSGS